MSSVSSANKRTFTQSISSTPQPDLADPNKRTKLPETLPLFTDASDREKATENLLQAFNANNEQGVKDALEAGADIDVTTVSGGKTPLMMAIERDWRDMAKFLLEKSSSVTINVSNQGQTALSLACGKVQGDMGFLTKLLNRCSDETINQVDKEGRTALMQACWSAAAADVVFLTKLLDRCSDKTINQIEKDDATALMLACNCVTDVVFLTKLLDRCSDETINQIEKEDGVYGGTALWNACRNQKDTVFLTKLLDRCCDETIKQIDKNEDRTALLNVCEYVTEDVVFLRKFLGRCSPETINHIDEEGKTALLNACRHVKDVGFLEILLGQTSDSALNKVANNFEGEPGDSVLTALLNDAANVDLAKHLVPLFLERLTWDNLKSRVSEPGSPDKLTAWQIVNQLGAPWADTAKRIGEAMVMACAQYAIPRSPTVEHFARNTKDLTRSNEEETRANICDQVLQFGNLLPKPIPSDVLYIIRSYHENPFYDLSQAVSAINNFMAWHLTVQKKKCPADGSHVLLGVPQVLTALHDSKSTLNQCLAEYKASRRKAAP